MVSAPSSCIAGAAQCSAEPQRWWLRLKPSATATLRIPGTHPDWGMLAACPHLVRDGGDQGTPACWDQYTAATPFLESDGRDFQQTSNRKAELLYSSNAHMHTAVLPTTVTPSCGTTPVDARCFALPPHTPFAVRVTVADACF